METSAQRGWRNTKTKTTATRCTPTLLILLPWLGPSSVVAGIAD